VSATHPNSRFEPQGLFGPVATRENGLGASDAKAATSTIPIIVGTNRVDSTRRRRALRLAGRWKRGTVRPTWGPWSGRAAPR